MDITPVVPKNSNIISRYGNGHFVVNDVSHEGSIIILPQHILPWDVSAISQMDEASFQAFFATSPLPELLLIGTGAAFILPAPAFKALLRARNIMMDAMDTGAACRTYNVLLTEGRNVAAALIAV